MFIVMYIVLGFKLYCFTSPKFFQSYFLPVEVSIGLMLHYAVCVRNTVL